jgi:very-short-patch-repair endonuclease
VGTNRFVGYRRDLKPRARAMRSDGTPAERKLWYEFLSALPQKFSRQKPLGRYIVDFYCSRHRLAIEIDGDSHYSGTGPSYDAMRTAWLKAQGVRVVRFTNPEVIQHFDAVCSEVLSALGKK